MNANELTEPAGEKARPLQDKTQQTAEKIKEVLNRKGRRKVRDGGVLADWSSRDDAYATLTLIAVTAFALGLLVGRRR